MCLTGDVRGETAAYVPAKALPFGRRSISWRVSAEPIVLMGGGRALLLQVAHPKVAAGVEQFSTYATDPWARLFRTMDIMLKLAFATPAVSAAQARTLERIHRRVVGTTSEGEPYSALDPDLLLWVWATLCDTALLLYEKVFPPLTPAEREGYYEEWKLVAHACGVPQGAGPANWSAFQSYTERVVAEELRATPEAVKVAHATAVPPLPWPLRAMATGPHQLITAGLFPETLRTGFGFGWDEHREERLRRLFRVLRLQMRLTPRFVRTLGTVWTVRRTKPMQLKWLQRYGAKITARRMAELERKAS